MKNSVAMVIDVLLLVVFVLIGRSSHAELLDVAGVLGTLWPFLIGCVGGWVASWMFHLKIASSAAGVLVWLATVALGMMLRMLTGNTPDTSFIAVASIVLAILLLGWRYLAYVMSSRRSRRREP